MSANYLNRPWYSELTRISSSTANVSIAAYPFELLPGIFKYGYAMPFYNLSRTVLTICFNTKNDSESFRLGTFPVESCSTDNRFPFPSSVGMNFGVQISWVVLNIVTITLFSVFISNRFLDQYQKSREAPIDAGEKHEAGAV